MSEEYSAFIRKLTDYHQQRGTTLDPEPRVGNKPIDLLDLFETVVQRGGYDRICEEKLGWRKVGQTFNLGSTNLPAQAFSLKSTYYKFLAAYEISTIHGKEPPPKDILEDVTAKGGGLLTRTRENYRASIRQTTMTNGDSDASGDEGTPMRDTGVSEEAPGSGGRATRGLRQAPPQRVLFQPDTQPSRQSRHHTGAPPDQSTATGASTSWAPNPSSNLYSRAVASYTSPNPIGLTLRPVLTPSNNPVEFARRQKTLHEVITNSGSRTFPVQTGKVVPPGSKFQHALNNEVFSIVQPQGYSVLSLTRIAGYDGPNIYVRCLQALKSGIPAEQDYALHHLVKISHERGDKFKFEAFPGLAEALIEKILDVSNLYFDVKWEISYMENGGMYSTHSLDGLAASTDILRRVANLTAKNVDDNIQTYDFNDRLLLVNEAALTLRNMVMLEENAYYVSELYPLRDFLSIALNLPKLESVVELKHYALEIAEQVTRYLALSPEDPLYRSLLDQLDSQDRGVILTSLRAISRISLNLEESNRLKGIPVAITQKICDWTLLVEDEELVETCLDFLYQYTARVENIDLLVKNEQLDGLVNQLTRLLSHGGAIRDKEYTITQGYRQAARIDIRPVPQALMDHLVTLDEPLRSSTWLRCLFEEDSEESITQIALWQAYQERFREAAAISNRPILTASEFIRNISVTFGERATAQVEPGVPPKFIIRGIRTRAIPVDERGREFTPCLWAINSRGIMGINKECGAFYLGPEKLWEHILTAHLGAQKTANKFNNAAVGNYVCAWQDCHRYHTPSPMKLAQMAKHIRLHLPQPEGASSALAPLKKNKSWMEPAKKVAISFLSMKADERGVAEGIPLTAVLVLKNLARNLPKTVAQEEAMKGIADEDKAVRWVERYFGPVEGKLWEAWAYNLTLVSRAYTLSILVRWKG